MKVTKTKAASCAASEPKYSGLARARNIFAALPIRSQLVAALVVVALLPSAVVDFYYSLQVSRLTRSTVMQFSSEKVQGAADEIRLLLSKTQAAEYSVIGNMVLSPLFTRPRTLSVVTMYSLTQAFASDLRTIMLIYPFISGIYVYSWDGNEYSTTTTSEVSYPQIKAQAWFRRALHSPHRFFVTQMRAPEYTDFAASGQEVVSYVQAVTASLHPWELTVIRIDINASVVSRLLNTALVEQRGDAALVGEGNTTLAVATVGPRGMKSETPTASLRSSTRARQLGRIVLEKPVTGYHLEVTALLPATPFRQALQSVRRGSAFIVLLTAIFALLVALLLSNRITRPLNRLVSAMREAKRGNLKVQAPIAANSDLRILTTTFNAMLERIDFGMRQNVEKERARSLAVFKALEAKINSHFLYNTLDVMRGIAFAHQDYEVVEMAEAMANIFRYSSNQERDVVPLRDEVRHIRDYARIQKHRYRDRIVVRCSIPKPLSCIPILKLSLQPLVENAFNHAFTTQRRAGKIDIRARASGSDLVLEVVDNGVGICSERVDALNRELEVRTADLPVTVLSERGVGIRNVNNRIHHLFGCTYGLCIESKVGRGTTVTMRLPLLGETECFM